MVRSPQMDYQVDASASFRHRCGHRSALKARWIIKDGKSERSCLRRKVISPAQLSPTDIAGSEALSDAVNTLSAQIAQSIKHLSEALGMAAKLRRAPMTTLSSD